MGKEINVLEYFYSIDGETKHSGELAWFIRLSGCNLSCSYCDTDFCHYDKGEEMQPELLVNIIMKTNDCRRVTVTGGEPLKHKNINELLKQLLINGFEVNIETNGSVNPKDVISPELFTYRDSGKLWFSMDYKSEFSGMRKYMITAKDTAEVLNNNDCLKFVVANREDLLGAYGRIMICEQSYDLKGIPLDRRCTYYLSPCFGQIELSEIINFMKEFNMIDRVKFQIQIHKIIWNPNKRGV